MTSAKCLVEPEPALSAILKKYSGRHIHFFPKSGNAGDGLIAYATYQLFKRFDIRFTTHRQTDLVEGQVVFIGGGGNLIEGFYPDVADIIHRHRATNEIVLLPHTIVGHRAILQETYRDLVVFCRDERSHTMALANGANPETTHLVQDMAFYLDDDHFDAFCDAGSGTLQALRLDGESAGVSAIAPENLDISLAWNGDLWTSPLFAEYATKSLAAFIAQYESVVTDRLHVSILASFLGKRVTLFPNNYYKNRAIYEHSMRQRFPLTRFVDTLNGAEQASPRPVLAPEEAEELHSPAPPTQTERADRIGVASVWRRLFPKAIPPQVVEDPGSPERLIVIVSDAPPSDRSRVASLADAAARLGYGTLAIEPTAIDQHRRRLGACRAFLVSPARWGEDIAELHALADARHVPVIFDVDERSIGPDVVAGSAPVDLPWVDEVVERQWSSQDQAPTCGLARTAEIAALVGGCGLPTAVLTDGFDEDLLKRARLAHRSRLSRPHDGLVRLGLAADAATYRQSLRGLSSTLVRTLKDNPSFRLALFRDADQPDASGPSDADEALRDVAGQIEWRPLAARDEMLGEIAGLDIVLALSDNAGDFRSDRALVEAALCGAVIVASGSGPFRRRIADGETGILVQDDADWHDVLARLAADTTSRAKLASNAYVAALATFGPIRRADLLQGVLTNLSSPRQGIRDVVSHADRATPSGRVALCPHAIRWQSDRLKSADVTVIVPTFNYAHHVVEALDSVYGQTLAVIDLVVVDDASTDESLAVCADWLERHAHRFNRATLVCNATNAGLATSRNVGFLMAMTPYCLPLDADNRLLPQCCETLLRAIRESNASFAYPRIREFGDKSGLRSDWLYDAQRLAAGNYIDAMALVASESWAEVGGYANIPFGWEDYDFWCLLAEHGRYGQAVTEVLAEYRVHEASMTRTTTWVHRQDVVDVMHQRHPWLSITSRRAPW